MSEEQKQSLSPKEESKEEENKETSQNKNNESPKNNPQFPQEQNNQNIPQQMENNSGNDNGYQMTYQNKEMSLMDNNPNQFNYNEMMRNPMNNQNIMMDPELNQRMMMNNIQQPMNDQENEMDAQEGIYGQQEKFVFNYYSTSTLYSINFQNSLTCRLAVGSMTKSKENSIEILELPKDDNTSDDKPEDDKNSSDDLICVYKENIEYPTTKLMWEPNRTKSNLIGASSECMRIYDFNEEEHSMKLLSVLHNKKSKYCGPLTAFDWNRENDSILGTASLDTTCAIWDLNKSTIRTQLIAHDKEVFDISFSNTDNIFISSGADGSVRLFDLRSLDHSTIIYETKDQSPITKIAWNMLNVNFIAALSWDKSIVYIFDSRVLNVSLVELKLHKEPVTAMSWSPNNQSQICSVSEDKNVIISNVQNDNENPNNVCYGAPDAINNVCWCNTIPDWIGITFANRVQLLRK
ncbi:MAG: hypothetical protein MJ252_30275 [archaeon]|nr:hypothetical protein [archaeon]